jgi:preprotein translocase subunit Sec63
LACQKTFPLDINLAFNPARKKAKKELKAHQKACSLMYNPEKVKKVLQEKWQAESQSSRINNAYSCRKC